jgi:hypothetical protein
MSNRELHQDEKVPPYEADDIAEIRERMRVAQQQRAAEDNNRPLGRGTHTKGVCVRAEFEVFDLAGAPDGLPARLGHGLFVKPGKYKATVRFANGQTRILEDSKGDVRAMSFFVEDEQGKRHDFAMNNATTFPWNDAHAFALLVRLTTATGFLGKLRAVASYSPGDLWTVLKTFARIGRQMKKPTLPYQAIRYWSTVPFQHGPSEVVKYSAVPDARNSQKLGAPSATMLRDALERHVTQDTEMSAWDFSLQPLDAGRMRRWWRKRGPSFWVENASVEWKESEAPFHRVGRLTLKKGPLLTEEECDTFHVDVSTNCAPECRPIGGINRARWYPEVDSRLARTGQYVEPLPSTSKPSTWIRRLTVGSVLRSAGVLAAVVAGLVTLFAGATSLYLDSSEQLPAPAPTSVLYGDQGWGAGVEAEGRQTYYYTAQGAGLKGMRYSWFRHLEEPWGEKRFADMLGRYGFIVDAPTDSNPHRLPVGFTKHFDRELQEELLDITCAACHTGQLEVTRDGVSRAIRIDGGQANHAFTDASFGHFLPTMIASMANTYINPFKFVRFAREELGAQYPRGFWELRRQFRGVLWRFLKLGATEKMKGLAPVNEGYGRTDALTRISNTVFAENLDESNYKRGTGPVNYPAVWNIHKFDWVQYNASVSQPMARNIGEAMGVGAKYALVDKYGRPLPVGERFRSTARIHDLHTIETTLQKLKPPAWPTVLFGPVDSARAQQGKALFKDHCESCHGPHIAPTALKLRNAPLKVRRDAFGRDTSSAAEWLVKWLCVTDIDTDPNTAVNFVNATVDIRKTGLTATELRDVARVALQEGNDRQRAYLNGEITRLRGYRDSSALVERYTRDTAALDRKMAQTLSEIDPAKVSVGAALSYLGTMIRNKAYEDADLDSATRRVLDGFGTLDLPQVEAAYKARPLAGLWATPPFLHNGSVPTIYDLLSPVKERPTTFLVGSREFDFTRLGLYAPDSGARKDDTRPTRKDFKGYERFDTREDGNANTGHEFSKDYAPGKGHAQKAGVIGPLLTYDERMAIIEHLKVRNDDIDGSRVPHEPEYPYPACVAPQKKK